MKDYNALGNDFKYFFEYIRTDEKYPSEIEKFDQNMIILSVFAEQIEVNLNF